MADEPTLDDILAEQQAIAVLADELTRADSAEKIEQITEMIAAMAAKLQAMIEALESNIKEANPDVFDIHGEPIDKPRPRIEVVLTREQQLEVKEQTGLDMTTVLIDDPSGEMNKSMPELSPDIIEAKAIEQAHAFNAMVEAAAERAREEAEAQAALEEAGVDLDGEDAED